MLDTFKARLKAKSKTTGANLSQKRIDAFADRLHKKFPDLKEEAEHDEMIDELDELVSFTEVAKDDDRIRTLEKKKPEPETTPNPQPQPSDPKPAEANEEPAWFKVYREATDAKINAFEKEKTQGSIKQQLNEKLKNFSDLVEWQEWQQPDTSEKVDEFVQKVTAKHEEKKQKLTEKGLVFQPAGGTRGGGNGKATKEEIGSLVDKILPK